MTRRIQLSRMIPTHFCGLSSDVGNGMIAGADEQILGSPPIVQKCPLTIHPVLNLVPATKPKQPSEITEYKHLQTTLLIRPITLPPLHTTLSTLTEPIHPCLPPARSTSPKATHERTTPTAQMYTSHTHVANPNQAENDTDDPPLSPHSQSTLSTHLSPSSSNCGRAPCETWC
ncbi:hypothetical protein BLNAU_15674 [Blattamonas nauphoetae]|uniref:Uncharacterized protein n=1 Tax=Blattamonas nauphoetae TaxID=2049346 RepID=A0ABQ9XA84_9EUKA|nr:hypothetical protein BLNAU_15674 [Blattamonas nauphoetae]